MAHTVPWHLLRTSAPLPAELVTHRLKSCDSVRRLLQLHEEHADGFNAYHASALWSRAGRLAFSEPSEREWALRNEGSAFGAVRVATAALSPQMSGRNVANASYGIWRAGLGQSDAWQPLWSSLAAAALSSADTLGTADSLQLTRAFGPLDAAGQVAVADVLTAVAKRLCDAPAGSRSLLAA